MHHQCFALCHQWYFMPTKEKRWIVKKYSVGKKRKKKEEKKNTNCNTRQWRYWYFNAPSQTPHKNRWKKTVSTRFLHLQQNIKAMHVIFDDIENIKREIHFLVSPQWLTCQQMCLFGSVYQISKYLLSHFLQKGINSRQKRHTWTSLCLCWTNEYENKRFFWKNWLTMKIYNWISRELF